MPALTAALLPSLARGLAPLGVNGAVITNRIVLRAIAGSGLEPRATSLAAISGLTDDVLAGSGTAEVFSNADTAVAAYCSALIGDGLGTLEDGAALFR